MKPAPQRDESARAGRIIRASELAQYRYCARAWWLQSVKGVQPANTRDLAQGEAAHRRHGQTVWLAGALRWVAIGLVVVAALLVILALVK